MPSIETLISNAKAYANEAVGEAVHWISQLGAIASMVNELKFLDNVPEWSYTKIGDAAQQVLSLVSSQRPNSPPGLGNFNDIGEPPEPKEIDMKDVQNIIKTIIKTIDKIPDRFNEAMVLFDVVNQKIENDLLNGGYGIHPSDEFAIWSRSRDRALDIMTMEIDEAKSTHATFGIPIPQGSLNKLSQQALDKAHGVLSDLNKDIAIKRADLYRTTREFEIGKAIELAAALMDITKTKIETLTATVNAELEIAKTVLAENAAILSIYGFRFNKIVESQKILASIYDSDINGWGARLGALTRAYAVAQQAMSDQLSSDRLVMQESIHRASAQIEAFNSETSVRIAAISKISDVLAHKVAGALSSLNTIVEYAEKTEKRQEI